jgi:hypothetical protein
LIGHFSQRFETHIDFTLSGGGDFMVVSFNRYTDLLHLHYHFTAQIVIGIGGTDRK